MDIRYTPRPDTTPEAEVETLRQVFRFVLECYERRNSNEEGPGEVETEVGDAEESPHEPSSEAGGG